MNGAAGAGAGAAGADVDAARALAREAMEAYRDDPAACRLLEGYARRLDEPLRVAIAGMVKAGKSTLLNAIIGEEIAPTDTGECTRVVTWYRYSDTPRITLYPRSGPPRNVPVKRTVGRLVFELGGLEAEDVAKLVVDWPSKTLRDITLIDTPGIASLSQDVSARSTEFLAPTDAPSEADAIIYLLRHLHASDLGFLESFRDTAAGQSGTVNALAVLSRADEVGAGRIDALLSAREVAARYRRDGALRSLALGVVPIAGLLAQTARSLRQAEFSTLSELASLDRRERERLLLSADRFVRPGGPLTASPEARADLLDRFGVFGLRLAAALLRGGISDPTVLAHELARRSGLDELLAVMTGQFQARAGQLKARTAVVGIEKLLTDRPRPGTDAVAATLERLLASAHAFRELRLLAVARTTGLPLEPKLAAEAERIIGGEGVSAQERLGLPRDTADDELREHALECLRRWHAVAADPLHGRPVAEICQTVVRSCEELLAGVQPASGGRAAARLVLGPEPLTGSVQDAGDYRRAG
ncbi:GTP-binding protein [Arthrobacter sp. CAU 1506]|nr:GTP-binding protein [Arthrobacter sp. CAU 1506]